MHMTPSVELLEAACVRVYTSGRRTNPRAVTALKMTPVLIKMTMRILAIVVSIENLSSLDEFCKSRRADKRQDAQQQDDF